MSDIEQPEPYVDDRVLRERTGISRETWQSLRSRGDGPPFYKVNRRVLYRWSQVVAWIESGRQGGAPTAP